ncbi:hypothetical protein MPSEU_000261700 [Mayamaea pseudoterrestris]|nr:hypothetical protein MPSEU_000261700 [Mayamaea pseudoterrestris]
MGKGKNAVRFKQVGGSKSAAMVDPTAFLHQPLEEIRLPVPPDRSYQIKWPLSLWNSKSNDANSIDVHDYWVVYPNYLDATKTVAQGRRIAIVDAVSPSPTVMDLSMALQRLNIDHMIQPHRGYSRATSVWDNPGRIMVLKSKLASSEIGSSSKMALLKALASIIQTQLPERVARLQREAQEQAAYDMEAMEYLQKQAVESDKAVISKTSSTATSSSSKTNKKGKKGRK